MDVDFLVLFQPSVHLVKGYFDEISEVAIVVNGNCLFGGAFPHDKVVCGGRITLLWVPQESFRHVGQMEVI